MIPVMDDTHSIIPPSPPTPHKLPLILTGCIKTMQRVRGSHLRLISGNYGGRESDEEGWKRNRLEEEKKDQNEKE